MKDVLLKRDDEHRSRWAYRIAWVAAAGVWTAYRYADDDGSMAHALGTFAVDVGWGVLFCVVTAIEMAVDEGFDDVD